MTITTFTQQQNESSLRDKTVSRITRVAVELQQETKSGEETRMRSELTSPSLLHKNQTPSKKKSSLYGFNTTSTTSPSSSSSPSLNARRGKPTWTEHRVITAQPHHEFFLLFKNSIYIFLIFFFTRTPLWHITSAKQHESTSTKRHHWDLGEGGRQDGGQVKGHETVDDTTSWWEIKRRATCCWQFTGQQQIHLHLIQHKYLYVD